MDPAQSFFYPTVLDQASGPYGGGDVTVAIDEASNATNTSSVSPPARKDEATKKLKRELDKAEKRKRKKANRELLAKPLPAHVLKLMDDLGALGSPFEEVLGGVLAGAEFELSVAHDDERSGQVRQQLLKMAVDWTTANREQMQKFVVFLERNGIMPMGGVEVPDKPMALE